MKAGFSTGLRVAAWSASSLLVVGAVAGTAEAATHHADSAKIVKHVKHAKHHGIAKDTTDPVPTATSSPVTAPTGAPGTGAGSRPAGPPRMLHGTETVENKDGSFETYAQQVGTVSAASATSITVLSADKYSATYAIDDSTHIVKNGGKSDAGDLVSGDTVMVMAEQENGGLTAEMVFDGKPSARPTPTGTATPGGMPTPSSTASPTAGPGAHGPGGFGFGGPGGFTGPPNGHGPAGGGSGDGDGGGDDS